MNLKNKQLLIIAIIIFLFLISADVVFADHRTYHPLVPCGGAGQEPCTQCDFLKLGKNLVDFILFFIIPVAGTLLITIAGFMILLGGANPGLISKGKSIFWSVVVGIAIISTSWLVVNFLLKSLAGESDISKDWYKLTCTTEIKTITGVPGAKDAKDTTDTKDTTEKKPLPAKTGTCQGVACPDSSVNVCGPITSDCSISSVNKWDSQIKAASAGKTIASGIDTIKMVKAVMARESGGNPKAASAAGSYGLMQLQPDTANRFKSGCVSSGTTITREWLLDPNNAQASMCIAINRLKSLVDGCGISVRHIAAGYNGGETACQNSVSCASCSICGSETTKKWECLWDGSDGEHKVCNAERELAKGSSFKETRAYAPRVEYCYSKF